MTEKIKELYEQFYNENFDALEEKRLKVDEDKNTSNTYITKRIVRRRVVSIIYIILIFLIIKFGINVRVPAYQPGQDIKIFLLKSVPYFIIPAIYYIYVVVIKPNKIIKRKSFKRNSNNHKNEYNDMFCERIFKPIIEYVIPKCQYDHNYGIPKETYESMGFPNNHDMYNSTDNITLDDSINLNISKVHTKFREKRSYKYEDRDVTLFCGIVSIQTFTYNMPLCIKIRNKKIYNLKLKNAVQLSNEEFNNYYQVETDNPELLNKYFTNNMLNYLTELAKNNVVLDVNIFQNKVCIRLQDSQFLNFYINRDFDVQDITNNYNSIISIIDINNFFADELKSNGIY